MSIEISDQFGDFTCGVWVKKRTVAIIRDLWNITKRHSTLENVLMFLQQHMILFVILNMRTNDTFLSYLCENRSSLYFRIP